MEQKVTDVLKPEEKIRKELEKINLADKAIADFKERYMTLTVTGLEDKEGLQKVHDARMEVRSARVGVQKYCKQARESANAYSKAVIAEEKRIVGLIEPIEKYLEEQESIIEKEKERLRQEAIAKEQAILKARIAKLLEFKMQYDGTGYRIGTFYLTAETIPVMDDTRFEEVIADIKIIYDAIEAKAAEEAAAKKAEEKRLADIAVAQKAEADRLDKLRKDQEAKDAAIKAEQEKEAAKLKADRDKLDAEKKALEDAKVKADQEKQRAIELEAAKKAAAEKATRDAEEKAVREAKEKADNEARIKAETERQEALKPDKDKLISFSQKIYDLHLNLPELSSEDAKTILTNSLEGLKKVASQIVIQTKTL